MNRKTLIATLMLLAVLTCSFVGTVLARPFFKDISLEKAHRMIMSNGHHDLIVIDLRPTSMYAVSHIPSAINVPFVSLPPPPNFAVLNAWISSPEGQSHFNDKIILHCIAGIGSPIAAQILIDAGFKKVNNMEGGFNAWLAGGV